MNETVQSFPLPGIAANDAAPVAQGVAKAPDVEDKSSQQPVRLVVEPTHGGQSYTYRLYDRATGALLIELPREEAVKLGQSPDYSAGQVLNTSA